MTIKASFNDTWGSVISEFCRLQGALRSRYIVGNLPVSATGIKLDVHDLVKHTTSQFNSRIYLNVDRSDFLDCLQMMEDLWRKVAWVLKNTFDNDLSIFLQRCVFGYFCWR